MPRSALTGVIALVVGAGVLGGCSRGEPQPSADPTTAVSSPTVSATPTATPTPTPNASVKPVRPAATDEVSAAGAEAVAVYFLRLYPYVYATNDLTEWKALGHPDCVFCKSVIDHVTTQVAAGKRSAGGLLTFSSRTAAEVNPGVWFSAEVRGVQGPWAVYDASGGLVESEANSKPHTFILAIVRQDGAWLVREVQVDDAPK